MGKIYVSAKAKTMGNGKKESPFQTIGEAAEKAVAGDQIIVAPGFYRECVCPKYGGESDVKRITYCSEIPGKAIISGAEQAKGWKSYKKNVWRFEINNEMFGSYNPYTELIKGDWYFGMRPLHTGEIFLNGKAMYEVSSLEEVESPKKSEKSWEPEASLYQWFTCQEENRTILYANFQGKNPNEENVEYTVRRNCFMPEQNGKDYITVQGFVIKQAATQWAPPTAYQDGMIGPHWAKGWIIEDCEISDSKCCGISLGKYLQERNENKWSTTGLKHGTQNERDAICQAQYEGWNKETIGSHVIRNCNIHDCGQAGIVGHLGGIFSTIENNHIHHMNIKQELMGLETGGIKMHAAIDVIFRKNHIHHCTRGIWLDWQAQGTRVTSNFFHDNMPPEGVRIDLAIEIGEDIYVEVSHGPTLIDHNILLSTCAAKLSTQGVAFVHNLIAGSFTCVGIGTDMDTGSGITPRYTPYHVPHRTEIAGFMSILHGDMRFYHNIFVQRKANKTILDFSKTLNEKGMKGEMGAPNLICGTIPYQGYPTQEAYVESLKKPTRIGVETFRKYFQKLPVTSRGNVFLQGAKPMENEEDFFFEEDSDIILEIKQDKDGYSLNTNLYEIIQGIKKNKLTTDDLGIAFEPEQKFENPDGSVIVFDMDYFGEKSGAEQMLVGPFHKANMPVCIS